MVGMIGRDNISTPPSLHNTPTRVDAMARGTCLSIWILRQRVNGEGGQSNDPKTCCHRTHGE